MSFKAVLFDLDGTLLDTLEDLAFSMNTTLAHMGYPQHSVESFRYFVGDGMVKLAQRVLPDSNDKEAVQECVRLMKENYATQWANRTKPYDGILELLERLRSENIICTVASNKPDEFTKKVVAHFFKPDLFRVVLGAGPFPPKPDPKCVLHIANLLEIAPEHFLYLGDTNTDMQTAVAAGMYPVGATWGFRTEQELLQSGAKTLATSPLDLLNLFKFLPR